MQRLNYHELVEKLADINRHLCEMGLSQQNRMRTHQGNIAELAHALDEGRLEQIAVDLNREKRREILWSFVESIEFVDALDALRTQDCDVSKAILQRALQGPADVYLEDSNSNLGRNTMFEIAIAGRAAHAGLKPQLGGEPDVFFEFAGRRMFVQCKRVFSEAAVVKRIFEAAKQLTRDLRASCDPRDCGLVAISVSKIINRGDKMLVIPTENDIAEVMRREIDALIKKHESACKEVRAPKIVGILLHIATPSFIEKENLFTVAQSATIYHIPGKSDEALLRKLAKTIKM